MKLPGAKIRGVPSAGRIADKSGEIRAAYNSLGAGLSNIADTITRIETDRLNQEAESAEHNAYIDKINEEAAQYSKTSYDPNDPILKDLNIETTRTQYIDGEATTVPRESIPADEVWPELMQRRYSEIIQNRAADISSPARRKEFVERAEKQMMADNLRMIERTTKLQYEREYEERKYQVNQLRTVGTPEAQARIDTIIASEQDAGRKAELQEWWSVTKVVDNVTMDITDGIQNLNAQQLYDGWQEYLGYASGNTEYTGPLNAEQLEDQAKRYKTALNQVNTLTNAGNKAFTGAVKYNARELISNYNRGYPANASEAAQVKNDLRIARQNDPDNESLYNIERDLSKAESVQSVFRDLITEVPNGQTISDVFDSFQQSVKAGWSNMDQTTRDIMHDVDGLVQTFRTDIKSNPITAIEKWGLDPTGILGTINFRDMQSLKDLTTAFANREQGYEFFRNIYEFNGDMLSNSERGQLNNMLGRDDLPNETLLDFVVASYSGLPRSYTKFWSPSISDKAAGKNAALGRLVTDWASMGNLGQGENIALTAMRGMERWAREPTLIEDYADVRESIRSEMISSYLEFPVMVDNYLDLAIAHTMATSTSKYISRNEVMRNLDTVTGGMVTQGDRTFMTPAAGLTDDKWDEYVHEVSTDIIKRKGTSPLGWSYEQVMENIRNNDFQLVPTGRSRNSFFVNDAFGAPIRYTDGQDIIYVYDEDAPTRFTRVQ